LPRICVVNSMFLHANRKLADRLSVMVYLIARLEFLVGRLVIREATAEVVSCSAATVFLRRHGEGCSLYRRKDTYVLSQYL